MEFRNTKEERAYKRDWLKRYRFLMVAYCSAEDDLNEIRATLDDLRSLGNKSRSAEIERTIHRLNLLEKRQIKKMNDAISEQLKIETAINQLDDDVLRQLLYEHYILGFKLEKVAQEMWFSERYIFDLHIKALDKIQIGDITND